MPRQIIRVGTLPKDGTGDPARTAGQKMNINFTELYEFLGSTADATTLPVAIPIEKGGTGATIASIARQNLGLGNSATKDTGTTEGSVMAIGTCGFGTDLAPLQIDVPVSVPVDVKSGELVYLSQPDVSVVSLGTRNADTKAQFGIKGIGKAQTVPVYRGSTAGAFTRWYSMFNEANAVVTVNGNLKYAENSATITGTTAITQHGQALTFTRQSAGVYLIGNATLNTAQWSLEVPMNYKGVTEFDVALEQVGTSLKVTVTQAAVAFDIPAGKAITVHLST